MAQWVAASPSFCDLANSESDGGGCAVSQPGEGGGHAASLRRGWGRSRRRGVRGGASRGQPAVLSGQTPRIHVRHLTLPFRRPPPRPPSPTPSTAPLRPASPDDPLTFVHSTRYVCGTGGHGGDWRDNLGASMDAAGGGGLPETASSSWVLGAWPSSPAFCQARDWPLLFLYGMYPMSRPYACHSCLSGAIGCDALPVAVCSLADNLFGLTMHLPPASQPSPSVLTYPLLRGAAPWLLSSRPVPSAPAACMALA